MARAVISTIGGDRPGIVNELTRIVLDLSISVEDSRMTVLGGEFAVLMLVAGTEQALETMEVKLTEFCEKTELAHLFHITADQGGIKKTTTAQVTVEAMDHPGIVHNVAAFFSDREINIRELNTDTQRAPHTGAPIFNLTLTVEIPTSVKIDELRGEFEAFCTESDLDGELVLE